MDAPTERRGEALPPDHPAAAIDTAEVDCIADVPASVLEELVEYHGLQVPEGEPVPEDAELV